MSRFDVILGVVFSAVAIFFCLKFSYDKGRERGYTAGYDEMLKIAVDAGAAMIYCDSRDNEVRILWITKAEDRKLVQEFEKRRKEADVQSRR